MKLLRFFALLLLCVAGGYAARSAGHDVQTWGQNLLKEKKVDTTEFYAFADTCIRYNNSSQLIQTYTAIVESGRKDIQPADLRFFNVLYNQIDTNRPTKDDFFASYYTGRIYIIYHLDSVLPSVYAAAALSIALKLKDDVLLLKAYRLLTGYTLNIKHDILACYSWTQDMEELTKRSDIKAVREGIVEVNIAYGTIYYYIGDYVKGIEYINKSIGLARQFHREDKIFELYMRRSYQQMEVKDIDGVLATMDTADVVARKFPNKISLFNETRAQRVNAYEAAGRIPEAVALSKTIDLEDLKGRNDEYYDYLYHVVRIYVYEQKYETAKIYIDLYMSELKGWNLQRLRNGYELKYVYSKETHDDAGALKYYELFNVYNDSVHHSAKNAAVIKEQMRYQTLQKDEALKLQVAENKIKVQTIRFIVAGAVTIVLVLLLLLAYRINKSLKEKERLNKTFAQQLIKNTEEEQNRLANELHDGLGQELLLLKNSLLQHQDGQGAEKVSNIIESVRGMARELYPALLDVVGLKAAIETQLHKIDQAEKIFVASELEYDGPINKECKLQLYRIFQEGVTNILKYAGATSMYVGLTEENGQIVLMIKDNGGGFNVEEQLSSGESFGLVSMQKRADAINGVLKINSSVKGTEITITILKDENSNS